MKIGDMNRGQRFFYQGVCYIVTSHNKDIGYGLQIYCCNLVDGRMRLFGADYCISEKDVL